MFVVNLIAAFAIAVCLWFVGSWALSSLVFRTETRSPRIAERSLWGAFESFTTLALFVLCVAAWIGLTLLLQQLTN